MRKRTPERIPPCLHSPFCIQHSSFIIPHSEDSMIITHPKQYRPGVHRVRPTVPAETLVLVAAAYDFAAHVLTLTFDRPVNIAAGVNVSAIVVDDSDSGNRYRGSAP